MTADGDGRGLGHWSLELCDAGRDGAGRGVMVP